MLIKTLALVSTVLLLMSLAFSVLGTTPLLVLKRKAPMDSRVVRQVFHYRYRMVALLLTSEERGRNSDLACSLRRQQAINYLNGLVAQIGQVGVMCHKQNSRSLFLIHLA